MYGAYKHRGEDTKHINFMLMEFLPESYQECLDGEYDDDELCAFDFLLASVVLNEINFLHIFST